jgi:hypothetical protein
LRFTGGTGQPVGTVAGNSPDRRLYVDEVGNADMKSSADPNHRFLGLTGVILGLEHETTVVTPSLVALKKKYFEKPGQPLPVLHRKEMLNRLPPFEALKDPTVRTAFDKELLALLGSFDYTVITVVIDKADHLQKYKAWQAYPYHYCLLALIERYAMYLNRRGLKGDVLAESRNKKPDKQLKASFARIFQPNALRQLKAGDLQCLTSQELKVKPKKDDVSGLQIADLVAHPSWRAMRLARDGKGLPDDFGAHVYKILTASKYDRKWNGTISGYGEKWLP